MTRRLDCLKNVLAVFIAACAPGCTQFPWTPASDADRQTVTEVQPRKQVFTTAVAGDAYAQYDVAQPKPNAAPSPALANLLNSPRPKVIMEPPPANLMLMPQHAVAPPVLAQAGPPAAPPTRPSAQPPAFQSPPNSPSTPAGNSAAYPVLQQGREPVVDALEALLENRNRDFLELLKKYDPDTAKIFEAILPLVAEFKDKNLDKFSPQEAAAFLRVVNELKEKITPMTELAVDNVRFCDVVKSFGNYHPLPDGHIFQAAAANRPGERVQLYVEIRNFASRKVDGFYETRLAASVEIRDARDGKKMWSHSFDDQRAPFRTLSRLHDLFYNYTFCLPQLPPGNYTLTVRIVDETLRDTRRESKSIAFRVGTGQR